MGGMEAFLAQGSETRGGRQNENDRVEFCFSFLLLFSRRMETPCMGGYAVFFARIRSRGGRGKDGHVGFNLVLFVAFVRDGNAVAGWASRNFSRTGERGMPSDAQGIAVEMPRKMCSAYISVREIPGRNPE
jgi:hypothetical protein